MVSARLWPGSYPIAQEREGNYISLDYEKGFPPRIAYVIGSVRPRRKVVISDSFTAFLETLY